MRPLDGKEAGEKSAVPPFKAMDVLEKLDSRQIADFCRKRHIRSLSLFGSALGDKFRPDSDVDMIVEFEAGSLPGLEFFSIQEELSGLVGRKVDLNTAAFLSPHFRAQVLQSAKILYAHA